MKKVVYVIVASLVLYLGANFRWVHAAAVVAVSPAEQCDQQLLHAAKTRIAGLFGGEESSPWLRCLGKPVLGQGVVIGTTNFMPGLPSIILLSPEGSQLDVIAHEWAHAELAERVGVLVRTYRVPTWFDEGLAMQVDERSAYGIAALALLSEDRHVDAPSREQLTSPSGFFFPGAQGVFHYAWSRQEVADWLRDNDLASFVDTVSLFRQPEL
ncbi:MAG: hypothetical protein GKR90_18740 [Pseudomonadales bacterium]|nr:hypothetical protein [Pseudomonadales bacterium]